MGSKGGLAGRPGTGVPEQSKGGSDSSFLPAIWGMDASGVFVRDACGVGLGRRIRGRLGGTWREHGVPSSGPSFGAREQGGSLPSPSLVSWLLRCHSGLDVPAQLREAPSPPACLNLAPPQATRPLPHPGSPSGETGWGQGLLVSVWEWGQALEREEPRAWPVDWVVWTAVRVGAPADQREGKRRILKSKLGAQMGVLRERAVQVQVGGMVPPKGRLQVTSQGPRPSVGSG